MRVLVLSSNYEPIGTCSWQDAITSIFLKKAKSIEEYDAIIKSPSISLRIPSVIVKTKSHHHKVSAIRYSKKKVWIRDQGCCQYCGKQLTEKNFTIDHVIPRSKGGKSTFENTVTCCKSCNQYKEDLTPKEAGMSLIKQPHKPSYLPYIEELNFDLENIHPSWEIYLKRV